MFNPATGESVAAAETPKLTILVVDDSPMMRRLLIRTILLDGEYEFLEAADATGAIKQLAVRMPDLMILDLNLGAENGFDLLASLKQTPGGATLPVVICTANVEERFAKQAWELGASGFVPKPINAKSLRSAIRAALHLDEEEELPPEEKE